LQLRGLRQAELDCEQTNLNRSRTLGDNGSTRTGWTCWSLIAAPLSSPGATHSTLGAANNSFDPPRKAVGAPPSPAAWIWSQSWRSALFPGWGQAHRGTPRRATAMAALGVVTLATVATLELLARQSAAQATSARTQARQDFYRDRTDNLRLARHLSAAGFALTWSRSLGDALVVRTPEYRMEISP